MAALVQPLVPRHRQALYLQQLLPTKCHCFWRQNTCLVPGCGNPWRNKKHEVPVSRHSLFVRLSVSCHVRTYLCTGEKLCSSIFCNQGDIASDPAATNPRETKAMKFFRQGTLFLLVSLFLFMSEPNCALASSYGAKVPRGSRGPQRGIAKGPLLMTPEQARYFENKWN
ncbi:hypothetical protein MTO96_035446 [Rhipicephalus appendiculatus]